MKLEFQKLSIPTKKAKEKGFSQHEVSQGRKNYCKGEKKLVPRLGCYRSLLTKELAVISVVS